MHVTQQVIDRLPHAFPNLRVCRFRGKLAAEGEIDVSPLAAMPELTGFHIDMPSDQLRGEAALPDRLVVHALDD